MDKITVGVHTFPPLTIKKDGAMWTGFEVEMWEEIAENMNVEFEYEEEKDFEKLLSKTKDGEYQMSLAGITRTSDRKEYLDISYLTVESGLAILSPKITGKRFSQAIKKIFTHDLIAILIALFALGLVYGHVYWLFERGLSVAQSYFIGIFESLWWVVVTFSTVGYGDIYPETIGGKVFGIFAIMTGLAIFGMYIGQVSSSLIVEKERARLNNTRSLIGKKIGTKKGTSSSKFLQDKQCTIVEYSTISEAYSALDKGEADAIVFDRSVLQYDMQQLEKKYILSEANVAYQAYAYIYPKTEDRELLRAVNQEIIRFHESGKYDELYKKYFIS